MKWTHDTLMGLLPNYTKISQLKSTNGGAYKALLRLGLLDTAHTYYNTLTSESKKVKKVYTFDELVAEASKYDSRTEFKYGSRVYYEAAKSSGRYDEVVQHLSYSTGFDNTKPATLYYLDVCDGTAFKIGITNNTLEQRFSLEELQKCKVISTWYFISGEDCRKYERLILETFKEYRYSGEPLLRKGNTELFSIDVLNTYQGKYPWQEQTLKT